MVMAEDTGLVDALSEQTPPPRSNGELVFTEPWEGRIFGVAVAAQEAGFFTAEEFRQALIRAIADDPEAPYYGSWSQALLAMTVEKGLLEQDSVEQRTRDLRDGAVDAVH